MKKYLVALDQGTTSSRAIVFDRSQQIVASAQKEFPQLYPQAGWVEHDPLELYSSQYGVMMEAITRGGTARRWRGKWGGPWPFPRRWSSRAGS